MMVETILESSQDFGMTNGSLPQWKRELLQRRAARSRPAAPPAPPPPPPPPPPHDEEDEELRYGPGIVKRLKSRYLSLALRDAPRRRPSVLRRAASLEHLLEERPPPAPRAAPPRAPRPASLAASAPPAPASRRDYIKRARSVDALSRLEARDEIAPPSPSPPPAPRPPASRAARPPRRPAPLLRDAERPPPDVVRSTLRKFESAPPRRQPPAARVSAVLRGLEARVTPDRADSPPPLPATPPPPTSPPPSTASNEVPIVTTDFAPGAPAPSAAPAVTTPTLAVLPTFSNGVPIATSPIPVAARPISPVVLPRPCIPSPAPTSPRPAVVPPPAPESPRPPPGSPAVVPASPRPAVAPPPAPGSPRPAPAPDPCADADDGSDGAEDAVDQARDRTADCTERRVSRAALENIARAGCSVRYSFEGGGAALSATNPVLAARVTRRVGVIRPLPPRGDSPARGRSPPPAVNGHSTPEPRVLARLGAGGVERGWAGGALAAVERPPWGRAARPRADAPPPTSVVFNFSDRKEVPDYIENDGIVLRGARRAKFKPGESGVVVLKPLCGAGEEGESDGEGEGEGEGGPPSPCRVRFVNDNVLINGRSSMPARPNPDRQAKLKLQFDDSLTRTFEYPSETSLCEDAHDQLADNTHIVSAALGRYTPCKSVSAPPPLGLQPQPPAPAPAPAPPAAAPARGGAGGEGGAGDECGDVAECAADAAKSWSEARALATDLLF